MDQKSVNSTELRTTVDLFCGAGGITEGFRAAGYRCLYGNDIAPWALETFKHNHPGAEADGTPIEQVDVTAVRRRLGLEVGELDVLVGGPPCQGFSINAPERFLEDPRNALFRHYMRFLDEFRPHQFMFENVPGMLSLAGGEVFQLILSEFRRHGYEARAKVLFSAHYGVPQERWRLIILGSREDVAPGMPEPTHFAKKRANFSGGASLTFRMQDADKTRLLPPVTVAEAIGDLPVLVMGQGEEVMAYDRPAISSYAQALRNRDGVVFNHVAARLSEANAQRMKHIPQGGSWRDIPHDLLPPGMQRARRSDHTRRYGRLHPDGLAGTIMTKCDPHWGPVFLPDQDRTLTVREAARIQSFPDAYRFFGPRVAQYEQVGNAVPVLMARAIAEALHAAAAQQPEKRRATA